MKIKAIDICPSCENGEAGNPYITCWRCQGTGEVEVTVDLEELIERIADRILTKAIEEATATING